METIRNLNDYRPGKRPAVLTLGNFDGVHAGHRRVIGEVTRRALCLKGKSVVMTFVPHTQSALSVGHAFKALTTPAEKKRLLRGLDVDRLILLPFDRKLMRMKAIDFFETVILKRVRPREIVLGHDHHFGKERAGGYGLMKRLCAQNGIRAVRIPPCRVDGQVVSSSLIRELLDMGKIEAVAALMPGGYPIAGRVVRGDRRGRVLGFPTANLSVPAEKRLPPDGVYAGTARVRGRTCRALISLGTRPTFGGGKRVLEAYLFDFKGNVYGENIILNLLKYLRPQRNFANAAALKEGMQRDVRRLTEILKKEDFFGKAE
jgi:riboflavin kinase/FMN adenylyltransferase